MTSKTMLDVSRSPSKEQTRTSKISDSTVLSRKLKNSLHRQCYQRAGAWKKHHSQKKRQMNDVKNHVGYLSKSIKRADQDLENICFYSRGWPN